MQNRWKERITSNPNVLAGKPVIVGTRISVEFILDCLASGRSVGQVVEEYPHIAPEDVLAALAFSADVLRRKPFITVSEVEDSAGGVVMMTAYASPTQLSGRGLKRFTQNSIY